MKAATRIQKIESQRTPEELKEARGQIILMVMLSGANRTTRGCNA